MTDDQDTANQAPGEKLLAQRLRKAAELRARGCNPYANDFRRDIDVAGFVRTYGPLDGADLETNAALHALAGRVVAINSFGKAAFLRVVDGSDTRALGDARPLSPAAPKGKAAAQAATPPKPAPPATAGTAASQPTTDSKSAPPATAPAASQPTPDSRSAPPATAPAAASPAAASPAPATASSRPPATGGTAAAAPGEPWDGRLQIYVRRDQVPEADWEAFKLLDLGDFVGVCGAPMRTKTGELTVSAKGLRILTKTLRPLPEKWHGLADVETRYRQRYLDLIANPEVRQTFITRSRLLTWLRDFFVQRGYLEVETPMMHAIAGGAAARPFKTHHNALGVDLFLRIAPELHLKRLVVGGFDRVFEINRNFRNEGISTVHNPEFTMLEFYQAYATFHDLMPLVEEMVVGAAEALLPAARRRPQGGYRVSWEGKQVDLARPFARFGMLEAIASFGGPAPDVARDPLQAAQAVARFGGRPEGKTGGQLVVDLFEHHVEPQLVQPTFIYDYPADVSPLSRRQDRDPYFVDRFELFVAGRELSNGFSELNDPVDQQARFVAQLQNRAAGDEEAHALDEDYVRALEHGMPPTAGCGVGIDRLAMLLTDSASIRDVILFPVLRPER